MSELSKRAWNISDITDDVHWAAIYEETMMYADGYGGESKKTYFCYVTFSSEEQIKTWILNNNIAESKFKIIKVQPAKVTKHVSISIEIE